MARQRLRGVPLVGLALLGCGGGHIFGPDGVDGARGRWAAQNITDYTYRLSVACFCAFVPDVVVTVRAGAIVGVVARETGEPVDPAGFDVYYTVNELFDLAIRARNEGADHFDISFDVTRWYPRRIEIDWRFAVADDEITITAQDLVVE